MQIVGMLGSAAGTGTAMLLGLKQFFIDGVIQYEFLAKRQQEDKKVSGVSVKLLNMHMQDAEVQMACGFVGIVAGVSGVLADLKNSSLQRATPLHCVSSGLFLFVNTAMLGHAIRQYNLAKELLTEAEGLEIEAVYREQQSAVLGIMSSLGCICLGALSLFGQSVAMAILIGGIATMTGFIKTMYDYLYIQEPTIMELHRTHCVI